MILPLSRTFATWGSSNPQRNERERTNVEEIRRKILPVVRKYEVQKAALFGSFVRDEQREDSDIDILVEFKDRENKTLLDLGGFAIQAACQSGPAVLL